MENIKISFPTAEEFRVAAEEKFAEGYTDIDIEAYTDGWQDCRIWLLSKIETIKL